MLVNSRQFHTNWTSWLRGGAAVQLYINQIIKADNYDPSTVANR